mgnify:CR=1 FL=1
MNSLTSAAKGRDARIQPLPDFAARLAREIQGEVLFDGEDVTDLRTAAYLVSIAKVAASYRAMGL